MTRAKRSLQTYLKAWSAVAFLLPAALVGFAAGERTMQVVQNFWLSIWTDNTVDGERRGSRVDNAPYIAVYFALGSASILFQVQTPVPRALQTTSASSAEASLMA